MNRLVEIEFPDDWRKGKCDICPLTSADGCKFGKLKNGWCTLTVKSNRCVKDEYTNGYTIGHSEGYKVGHSEGYALGYHDGFAKGASFDDQIW